MMSKKNKKNKKKKATGIWDADISFQLICSKSRQSIWLIRNSSEGRSSPADAAEDAKSLPNKVLSLIKDL